MSDQTPQHYFPCDRIDWCARQYGHRGECQPLGRAAPLPVEAAQPAPLDDTDRLAALDNLRQSVIVSKEAYDALVAMLDAPATDKPRLRRLLAEAQPAPLDERFWHRVLLNDPHLPDCGGTHVMGYATCQRLARAYREDSTDQTPHRHDETRCEQDNIWMGADTCECICGCRFMAVGHPRKPLCYVCEPEDSDE